jgi:general stress protein YciG
MAENNNQKKRGFAAMDPDEQREIASEGGKAAHQKGTANEFDSESGREAGRKGGQARQRNAQTEEPDNLLDDDLAM